MKEITDKQDKISNSQDKITESQEKISLALSNLNALISNKFDKYDARFISIEEDIGELKNIIKDNSDHELPKYLSYLCSKPNITI